MEATAASRTPWTFAQWAIVIVAVFQLTWATAGLIAEPSFDYVAVALIVTGIWAIFSTSPAGIFTFPNNGADAVLHITTGALFATIAAIQLRLDRRAS